MKALFSIARCATALHVTFATAAEPQATADVQQITRAEPSVIGSADYFTGRVRVAHRTSSVKNR
jgi:hypothetical protein